MTLANKLTVARIVTVPMIVIGLLEQQFGWIYGLLIFSMATDFLDGLAARKRGERTKLGAFLDPMADKLLLISVFMTLAYLHQVPMWIFVVIFSRDLLIVLGWLVIFILTNSSAVEPRVLGKTATAAQMITALACIADVSIRVVRPMWLVMIALTVCSAVDYIIVGEKKLGSWT